MRLVDIDAVLDLFGIGDSDIYAKGTINDAVYDGTLKIYTQSKVGEWVKNGNKFICPFCGNGFTTNSDEVIKAHKYCYYCGAKIEDKNGTVN